MKSIRSRTNRTAKSRQAALSTMFSMPFELVDGKAPSEFRIFAAGDNPSTKGLFLFDDVSQQLVMERYAQRGVPMMMDYEHQSAQEPPIEAPASAKAFVPQVRDGELWATDIVWTDRARCYLESGEYRLFSPWFSYVEQPDGRLRITSLTNVALTNNPALHNIEPLMAASDKDDDMDDEETTKLKAENASLKVECAALKSKFEEMEAGFKKLSAKKDAGEDEEAKAAATASATLRDEVLSLTGKKDIREATGVLRSIALKAKGADQAMTKLAEIEADSRDKEFAALLTDAFKEGKVSPAQRKDFWEKKGKGEDGHVTVEGLAMLKDFLPTAPVQINLKQSAEVSARGGVMRSAEEKHVMARFGMTDPEEIKRFDQFRATQADG